MDEGIVGIQLEGLAVALDGAPVASQRPLVPFVQPRGVAFVGAWLDRTGLPDVSAVEKELTGGGVNAMEFGARELGRWGSALMVRILALNDLCATGKIEFRAQTLPDGLAKLIALSQAVPEKADAARKEVTASFLQRVGESGPGGLDRRRGHA